MVLPVRAREEVSVVAVEPVVAAPGPVVPEAGVVAGRAVRVRSEAGVPVAPRVSVAVRSRAARRYASC